MRRVVFLFFILLSACSPAPVDPYYMIQAGEELQNAGNAAILATQQSRHELAEQLAMAATGTADAQSVLATSQALKVEHAANMATITADAHLAQIAQVTARAVEANATQSSYLTGLSLSATQTTTAIALESDRLAAERERRMGDFRSWLVRTALSLVVFAITAYLIYTLWRLRSAMNDWIDWRIEWLNRRNHLFETRSGTAQVTPNGDGTYTIQLISNRLPSPSVRQYNLRAQSDVDHVERLNPSGSVLMSPLRKAHPDGVTILAVDLIRQSIDNGWIGEQIPGHRKLDGWSGEKWSRAVAALTAAGALETTSEGTFVSAQYECTVDILDALQLGKLKVRPAPPPDSLQG